MVILVGDGLYLISLGLTQNVTVTLPTDLNIVLFRFSLQSAPPSFTMQQPSTTITPAVVTRKGDCV